MRLLCRCLLPRLQPDHGPRTAALAAVTTTVAVVLISAATPRSRASQVAGNRTAVEHALGASARMAVRRPEVPTGGMWVRGLCTDCNNLAGVAYDRAYPDFANRLRRAVPHGRQLTYDARGPGIIASRG
jgi:hypothetical protein